MYALNFYSPLVADQLRHRRKTVTIRLGDKSSKYRKGIIVRVLTGQRFGLRDHIFDAVIDKVEVKRLGEVSPREVQHDNPEVRTLDEFISFLGQLYNREVDDNDTVTVIHFSEIRGGESPARLRCRRCRATSPPHRALGRAGAVALRLAADRLAEEQVVPVDVPARAGQGHQ